MQLPVLVQEVEGHEELLQVLPQERRLRPQLLLTRVLAPASSEITKP